MARKCEITLPFLIGYQLATLVPCHDIDYPWPRPQPDWDEDSLVNDSFLALRPNWKVVISGSILTRDYLPQMRAAVPTYSRTPYRRYNALWMTRTA